MIDDKQLHRWIEGKLSPDELEDFRQRPEYPDLERIYRHTEHLTTPSFDQEGILKEVLKSPKQGPLDVVYRRVRRIITYAAAACIIGVVGWFLWNSEEAYTELLTQKAETINEVLPDGSAVQLNADTKLQFIKANWPEKRILDLEGEAYFEVIEGSDFEVFTPYGKVQVLGTKFNVRARDQFLEVICQSGKVRVASPRGDLKYVLNPGDGIRIQEGKQPISLEGGANKNPQWLNGIFKFKDVPLAVPLAEIERQFDIEIVADKVDLNQEIRCNFQNEDLELALTSVLGPTEYTYKIESKNLVSIILK